MRWERTAGATSAAPPDRVWAVLLDGLRWSEWHRGVEWMTLEGPPIPGTVLTMKPHRAPQTAFRIGSIVADRLLELVLTFGPVARLRLRWELAPDAGGTAIVQTVGIDGPLAGLLLRGAARRIAEAMPGNLERLAVHAVSSGAGHTSDEHEKSRAAESRARPE